MTDNNHLPVKFFIGVKLTPERSYTLQHSTAWQEAQFSTSLKVITHQGNQFLGFFVAEEQPSLDTVKEQERTLRRQLKGDCPEITPEAIPIKIFPQVFIS
ncbi:MAG: hypothetical protein ACQEP8_01460 [Chlamydiota bacterium]